MTGRYRIDELARVARTTVRNVRSYQEKGLMPAAGRDGRAAVFDASHVARLRLIGTLLERGYTLQNISELIAAWEGGQNLRDLLGLEAAVTAPFSNEPVVTLSLQQLMELLQSDDVEALGIAVEAGLLEPVEGGFRTSSLRLLKVGAELSRAGVPAGVILQELMSLRRDLDKVAGRLVAMVSKHVLVPQLARDRGGADAKHAAALVRRLRPLAEVAVTTELARALEEQVRVQVGKVMPRLVPRPRAGRSRAVRG